MFWVQWAKRGTLNLEEAKRKNKNKPKDCMLAKRIQILAKALEPV